MGLRNGDLALGSVSHAVKANEGAVGGLEPSLAPLRLPVVLEDKHPLCEEK